MKILLSILLLAAWSLACSSGSSDSSGGAANSNNPSTNTNTNTETDTEEDEDDSTNTNTNNPVEEQEEEVALISEERARGIIEASCLAAGCHATPDQVLENGQIIFQLETSLMPPLDQSRYTLSDTRRAELVKYLKSLDE